MHKFEKTIDALSLDIKAILLDSCGDLLPLHGMDFSIRNGKFENPPTAEELDLIQLSICVTKELTSLKPIFQALGMDAGVISFGRGNVYYIPF